MRRALFISLLALATTTLAKNRVVEGKVTYISSGTIYTSLGREAGLQDSALIYMVKGADTLTTMKAFALSSRSSACTIVSGKGTPAVGDRVTSIVVAAEPAPESDAAVVIPPVRENANLLPHTAPLKQASGEPPAVELKGRISAQFYTTLYSESTNDIMQPGVVLNVQSRLRDVPVSFELYSNVRTLNYVNTSRSINQSRIYRLSIEYDDGDNRATLGRFAPAALPSIGYTDGIMIARRFGELAIGGLIGFQPSYTQRNMSTDYRKLGGFVTWEPVERAMASVAYARTTFKGELDREVTSVRTSFTISRSLSVYALGDFDLRKKKGDALVFSPGPSLVTVSVHYRIIDELSLGAGYDASRPLYSYTFLRSIPDSLVDTRIRTGARVSFSLHLPMGISLSNTYTPRSSEEPFARDFSDNAALSFINVGETGVHLRTTVNVNSSRYTRSLGYGFNAQRNWWNLFDLTVRYQQYSYTIRSIQTKASSTSFGTDVLIPITRNLAFAGSYDRLQGSGISSNAFFAELTVRF